MYIAQTLTAIINSFSAEASYPPPHLLFTDRVNHLLQVDFIASTIRLSLQYLRYFSWPTAFTTWRTLGVRCEKLLKCTPEQCIHDGPENKPSFHPIRTIFL